MAIPATVQGKVRSAEVAPNKSDSSPGEMHRRSRAPPIRPVSCGALRPTPAAAEADQPQTRRTASGITPTQPVGPQLRDRSTNGKNEPRHA
jgi:hypothetical protein